MSAIIFPSTQNFLSCKLFRISFVSLCLENVEREWMGTAVLSCSWFSSDYSPCTFTSYNVVVLFFLEPSPVHDSTIFCLAVLLLTYLFWHIFVVLNRCNIQGILSFHACSSVIAMLLKCTTGYHCKLWHLLFHW